MPGTHWEWLLSEWAKDRAHSAAYRIQRRKAEREKAKQRATTPAPLPITGWLS